MNRSGEAARRGTELAHGRGSRRGEILGDTYRLRELVGAGGMAEVYAAEHLRLDRQFAVKVLRAGTCGRSMQRFRREVSAVARIDNEFVVGVIDCGETGDGTPYLVMDLLRGEDLRALLGREGALPIPRAVNLVWEACQGIAAVHALGLIHRDLKPENLYISKRSTGRDWCRVLDFGIAKSDVASSTAEGAVVGTVRYMAPEQLQDAASVGPSADVYALGAVLYECLSGSPPYRGAAVQELMFKILNERPPRLERSRPGVPKALADAVERALSKSPKNRFADIQQFANAIAPYTKSVVVDELDAYSATVEFSSSAVPRSAQGSGKQTYVAIALSGFVGVCFGAFSSVSTVFSASSRLAQASPPQIRALARASASASASSTRVAVSVPALESPASAPVSSLPALKVSERSGRRPPVSSPAQFDTQNPYGQ